MDNAVHWYTTCFQYNRSANEEFVQVQRSFSRVKFVYAPLKILVRLEMGGAAQDAASDVGIGPEHLDGCDEAVAAERRREPGNAGIRIRALRRIGCQHAEIDDRAMHPPCRVNHGIHPYLFLETMIPSYLDPAPGLCPLYTHR